MFFGAAVPSLASLLATHPPLEERIKRIDPRVRRQVPPVRLDEDRAVADTGTAPEARTTRSRDRADSARSCPA